MPSIGSLASQFAFWAFTASVASWMERALQFDQATYCLTILFAVYSSIAAVSLIKNWHPDTLFCTMLNIMLFFGILNLWPHMNPNADFYLAFDGPQFQPLPPTKATETLGLAVNRSTLAANIVFCVALCCIAFLSLKLARADEQKKSSTHTAKSEHPVQIKSAGRQTPSAQPQTKPNPLDAFK